MYLDPGSFGMAVQAFFALVAAVLSLLTAPRQTLARLWKKFRK